MSVTKTGQTISDTITFTLTTTDSLGDIITPYQVISVTIYFQERDYVSTNYQEFDMNIDGVIVPTYYNSAQVVQVFGDSSYPAWLSTDTTDAILTLTSTGTFSLTWTPDYAREGDYIICWSWMQYSSGDTLSAYDTFTLEGDTEATTSIPTAVVDPTKYPTLLDRYTPEVFKLTLSDQDITPQVLNNLNLAISSGFAFLENFVNSMPYVIDANVLNGSNLLYLSNLFGLELKSTDPTLWRRQIKNAIPLYKMKGTLKGLTEAFAQAGMTLNSLTRLWQVVSPSTWQDGFLVNGSNTFTLSKTALSVDASNFAVSRRSKGNASYSSISLSDIVFTSNSVTINTSLNNGDYILVLYKIANVPNQSNENYIRSLPIADQRDETTLTYPPKNWNVRLIEETDTMFSTIIPDLHPFANDIVWGKIFTEFAYGENLYNSDAYDGSLRDSTDPCAMDKNFLDSCSACLSSSFNIDVSVDELSDNRIQEIQKIIDEYAPFHAQLNQTNLTGSFEDFIVPQVENIQCLATITGQEIVTSGQHIHNRYSDDVLRDMLSTVTQVDTANGTLTNNAIVLSSYTIDFSLANLGLDVNNNFLEILSGTNQGTYTVNNPSKQYVQINQNANSISYPLDKSAFPFRLSNQLFSGSVTSISQDNVYSFTDDNVQFAKLGAMTGWHIVVTLPSGLAGTYPITAVYPNNTLTLSGWTNNTNSTGITYQLTNNSNVAVGSQITTGQMSVTLQGLVTASDSTFISDYGIETGDYLGIFVPFPVNQTFQYQVNNILSADTFTILNWSGGNVGTTNIKMYHRLLDNKTGYLGYSGLTLTTLTNYESNLGIVDGVNGSGQVYENDPLKEEFIVQILENFYKITQINNNTITLVGVPIDVGLVGQTETFTLLKIAKNSITIDGQFFYSIDRRNNDVVSYQIETVNNMSLMMSQLSGAGHQSLVGQSENIKCYIEYLE